MLKLIWGCSTEVEEQTECGELLEIFRVVHAELNVNLPFKK